MTLLIEHPEADRLARELAVETGESLTEAVIQALQERLGRERARHGARRLRDELRTIRKRCAALAVLDERSPDDLLGYDERGLPR